MHGAETTCRQLEINQDGSAPRGKGRVRFCLRQRKDRGEIGGDDGRRGVMWEVRRNFTGGVENVCGGVGVSEVEGRWTALSPLRGFIERHLS